MTGDITFMSFVIDRSPRERELHAQVLMLATDTICTLLVYWTKAIIALLAAAKNSYFCHFPRFKHLLYSTRGGKLPAVRAVQGDCETVFLLTAVSPTMMGEAMLVGSLRLGGLTRMTWVAGEPALLWRAAACSKAAAAGCMAELVVVVMGAAVPAGDAMLGCKVSKYSNNVCGLQSNQVNK